MNIVTIRQNAVTLVQAALGAGFKELPFSYEIEMNDERALASGFTVTVGNGDPLRSVDQAIGVEQDLYVTITKRAFVRNDDSSQISAADSLYTACDQILRSFVYDKFGIKDVVQRCELKQLGRPQTLGKGRDIVSVELQFRVRYLLV